MNKKAIGARLRRLRGKRSQQKVAQACGITQAALSYYEKGEKVPRDDTKIALAKYYKRSVSYLFFS